MPQGLIPALVLSGCAGALAGGVAFDRIAEPDRGGVVQAARALVAAPAEPLTHVRFIAECVRAGARKECDTFYRTRPQAAFGLAMLALGFGELAPAEARLRDATDPDELRLWLALAVARHLAEVPSPGAAADSGAGARASILARARAALAVAKALPAKGEALPERALTELAVAIMAGEFASAHEKLELLASGSETLAGDQRERLLLLGERLVTRASDIGNDAADQARRLFADMNQLSADEALVRAESAADRFPDANVLWIGVGLARLKAANEPGAVAAFERAKLACPFDPEPDFQLAKLHERRARYARAVHFLERGLASAPAWSRGLWLLTDLALLARDPAAAGRALARLKVLYPDDLRVDLGRARALLESDDGLRALGVLKEAARHYPSDLRPALALAKTALTLHRRTPSRERKAEMLGEAEHALTLAMRLASDHVEVRALETALQKARGEP